GPARAELPLQPPEHGSAAAADRLHQPRLRTHFPEGTMRTILRALTVLGALASAAHADGWKAGVAVRTVTPKETMWMPGYAARTKPAEGKEQDLYVKALAIEDPAGTPAEPLASDVIRIPRSLGTAA